MIKFFRIFGEMRPGGQNLVERYSSEFKLAPVETIPYSGSPDDIAKIKVFRSGVNQESEIYILDEEATLKNKGNKKAVYLSLYKTSNNKKHIVGGKNLDYTKVGKDQNIEDYRGFFNVYLQTAEPRQTTPDDYVQLCRL